MEILLEWFGRNCYVEPCTTYYTRNRSLAVLLYDKSSMEPEILEQLASSGLGKPIGRKRRFGFVEYSEFWFNERILLECGSESYEEYL